MPGDAMSHAARWLAIVLTLGAAPAFAQNDAGQAPPKAEPPPVADKGATAQYNCLDESEKHVASGRQLFYRITLTNKCEQRLKCAVFAYQVGLERAFARPRYAGAGGEIEGLKRRPRSTNSGSSRWAAWAPGRASARSCETAICKGGTT
jgi:hypothetical protein